MQKRLMFGLIVLLILCAAAVYAFGFSQPSTPAVVSTATTTPITVATTTDNVQTTPVTKPVVTATSTATTTPVVHPTSGTTFKAYLTGYAWPDNTPPGSAISNPIIHHEAGGTGTYADPITVAVGHSFINGEDVLDYKAGTVFYMPYLRKYFIAEDTCGDGDTPQNVPCHNLHTPGNEAPAGAEAWLDLWVGGVGSTQAKVLTCEDAITGLHTVIMKPSQSYAVNPGAVYESSCAQQFSDTPVMQ